MAEKNKIEILNLGKIDNLKSPAQKNDQSDKKQSDSDGPTQKCLDIAFRNKQRNNEQDLKMEEGNESTNQGGF